MILEVRYHYLVNAVLNYIYKIQKLLLLDKWLDKFATYDQKKIIIKFEKLNLLPKIYNETRRMINKSILLKNTNKKCELLCIK